MVTLIITNTGRGNQALTQYGTAQYGTGQYGGSTKDNSDDGRLIITNNE